MHTTSAGGGRRLTPTYRTRPRDPERYAATLSRYRTFVADQRQRVLVPVPMDVPRPRRVRWAIDIGMVVVWTIIVIMAFSFPWLVAGWLGYAAIEVALLRWG